MANTGKAAIIVVNWNAKRFLDDCMSALDKQTYKNFDVYFVDNGSTDGSSEYIKDKFSHSNLIQLSTNTGFAFGNNAGISEALKDPSVDYVVFLNNDTIVEPKWLESLVKEVDLSQKIDMVSSMALFTDGNVQTIGMKFEKDLIGTSIGGLSIGYGEDPKNYSEKFEIFCPCGVSALFTRRCIEDIGMFDPDFFCYSEDLDLGLRAHNKGYKCVFTPEARLVHLHSQSSGGRASAFKAFLIQRNNYFVAIKNFSILNLILYPFRNLMWMIKSVMKKDPNKSSAILKSKIGMSGTIKIVLKAYWEVLLMSTKMFKKRYKERKF